MAKILLLDIETLPNIVTSWRLWQRGGLHLDHKNIIKEQTILSAAWKFLGEPKVHSQLARNGNDKALCRRLNKVFDSADVVVAHNGDYFDIPWVKGRLLFHGLPPMRPIPTIDTKALASRHFYLNSNRLDYLGQYLGVGKKIKTDYDLWLDCMNGDEKALQKMLRYNREDVRLLERIYLKLRPFVPAKLNLAIDGRPECPSCGAANLIRRGYGQTRASRFLRFQCRGCGAWSQQPLRSKVVR